MDENEKHGDGGCYQPGWDRGPEATGLPEDEYVCELDADHDGPHGWDLRGGFPAVSWPVAEVRMN